MDWPLYLKHKATAYHLRDRRSPKPSRIATCSCGWHGRMMRPSLSTRARRVVCALDPKGHRWGEPEEWSFGPIDHVVGTDDDMHGLTRQCDRCYKVKDVGT